MSRKSKYSLSFKLKAVQKALNGSSAIEPLASSLGIGVSMLKRWVAYYQRHGESGLQVHNNQYTVDFKVNAINVYQQEGLSLSATCLRFHIPSPSVLKKWLDKYKEQGETGLFIETRGRKAMAPKKPSRKTTKPKTREQELEEQLEYLKLENQYLKKLQALIQQEEQQKSKKQS